MDLSVAREEAEIAKIYAEIGAWTVEEIRGRQGLGTAAEQQPNGG